MAETSLVSLASQRKRNSELKVQNTQQTTKKRVIQAATGQSSQVRLADINRNEQSGSPKDAQKNLSNIQKLLEQMQTAASTKQSQAEAQDVQLYGQQLNEQNNSIATMQAAYQQMLVQQQALSGQYGSDLQSQLSLLKEQNGLLVQQGQMQSSYLAEQRAMLQKQQQLQDAQLARAEEENKYTSMTESVTNSQNAAKVNRFQQQLNRRRAIQRFGTLRTS